MVNFRKRFNLDRPDRKSPLLLLSSNAALFLKGLHTRLARRLAGKSRGFRAAAGFGLCFVLVSLVFVSATSCMSNGQSDGQALEVHLDNPITMTGGTLNSTTTVVNNTTTLIGNTTTQVQNTTTQYPTTTIQNTTTVQNTTTQYPTTTVQNTTTQYPTTTQVNNTTTQVNNTTTQVATTTVGCLYGAAASIPAIGSVPDGQMYIDTDDDHWWQAQYISGSSTIKDSTTNFTVYTYGQIYTNSGYEYYEAFEASASYSPNQIGLWLAETGSPTDVKVVLQTDYYQTPGGTVLSTSNAYTTLSGSYGWVYFTMPSVSLSAGTYYDIIVSCSGDSSDYLSVGIGSYDGYYSDADGYGNYPYSSYSNWNYIGTARQLLFKTGISNTAGEAWVEIK